MQIRTNYTIQIESYDLSPTAQKVINDLCRSDNDQLKNPSEVALELLENAVRDVLRANA